MWASAIHSIKVSEMKFLSGDSQEDTDCHIWIKDICELTPLTFLVFSCLVGREKETYWKWHCYHSISGRRRRVVVLQTVYDPIALHPYPSHGQLSKKVMWQSATQTMGRGATPTEMTSHQHHNAEMMWTVIVFYSLGVSLTSLPDIFALVRYNSQNDSYRWVFWSMLHFVVFQSTFPTYIDHIVWCHIQIEDLLRGERSIVRTPSPISARVYRSSRIQGLFIGQM